MSDYDTLVQQETGDARWGVPRTTLSATPTKALTVRRWEQAFETTSAAAEPAGTSAPTMMDTIVAPVVDRPLPRALKVKFWREAAEHFTHIEVSPVVMGSEPVIRDTRIPVSVIVAYSADGFTVERIVEEFEARISPEQVREAFHFASMLCH